MRAILLTAVVMLASVSSCGGFIFLPSGSGSSYAQPPVQHKTASLPPAEIPELRLPYVSALELPRSVYAGESFTIRFEISAEDAPQILSSAALPPLWTQAEMKPVDGYLAQLRVGPWLLANPLELDGGGFAEALEVVEISLSLDHPGAYQLISLSADSPQRGGRPARYTADGVEFIRGKLTISERSHILQVLPARRLLTPRSYNEPFGAYRSSEATWNYGSWPGTGQPLVRQSWDW